MRTLVAASISAPFSISTCIASTCPLELAKISDVAPSCQPAGKRAQVRGGGGDASDGACVVHARVPMHYV